MVTKDELKKEVDKIPDNLLEEAYALLRGSIKAKPKRMTQWVGILGRKIWIISQMIL